MKSIFALILAALAVAALQGCEPAADPDASTVQSEQKPVGEEVRTKDEQSGNDLGGATEPVVD